MFDSISSLQVYYLHTRSNKAKKLSGWRAALAGSSVEAVAFDANHVSESTTRAVLLGTDNGRLFETVVDSTGKAASPVLHYALEQPVAISGLHVHSVGGSGGGSHGVGHDVVGGSSSSPTDEAQHGGGGAGGHPGGDAGRLFVMLSTDAPTRLYSFLGGPTYFDLFEDAKKQASSASATSTWSFTELGALEMPGGVRGAPAGSRRAELHWCAPATSNEIPLLDYLSVRAHSGCMREKCKRFKCA